MVQEGTGRRRSAGVLLPVLLSVLVAGALLVGPPPAAAHPFGEPQTVRLSADGSRVTLVWRAPADDLLLVGGAVGALPSRREIVIDLSPDGDPETVAGSDAERLTNSSELAAYLAERLAVRQDGRDCPADVSLDGLVADGAVVIFDCPATVEEVTVEVATLIDLHEAYRTVALGDATTVPERALYTSSKTVQTWQFSAVEQDDTGGAGVGVWALTGLPAGLVVLGVAAWQRLRRRPR